MLPHDKGGSLLHGVIIQRLADMPDKLPADGRCDRAVENMIAVAFGFEYEQTFIRAFKREFSTTPGQFRKQKAELCLTPRQVEGCAKNQATQRNK